MAMGMLVRLMKSLMEGAGALRVTPTAITKKIKGQVAVEVER